MPVNQTILGVKVTLEYLYAAEDVVGVGYKVGSTVKELAQSTAADVAMDFNFANNIDIAKTLQRDSFCIQSDGSYRIGKPDDNTLHSVQGSPRLLDGGLFVIKESIERDKLGADIWANNVKHLRVAIGLISPTKAVIVRTHSAITLHVLAQIMANIGCTEALAGDGGGSTYLYPYDNGWGRKMGSAITVKKGVVKMYGLLKTKQDFIPAGFANRPADKRKPQYITVHDTANQDEGADAERHAKYLKDGAVKVPASWHWTVDENIAIQHLPHDESAYHAGDGRKGTGNAQSIGVEICEHVDGDRAKAEDNAAILIAHIMKNEGLKIDAVVQHNKWSGKNCPASFRGAGTWNAFLAKIKKEYDAIMQTAPNKSGFIDVPDSHWASTSIKKAADKDLLLGVGERKFDPNGPVTRAQLAVILDRAGLLEK